MTNFPNRHSIRLPNYDYSSEGYYFVTMCTQKRKEMFGKITKHKMILNNIGKIIKNHWELLPKRFPIKLDLFQIMPNHLHGIIQIVVKPKSPAVGVSFMKPDNLKSKTPIDILKSNHHMGLINQTPTLGHIIRHFKGITSKKIHEQGFNIKIWQRNFHEHIIRNENKLNKIRQYIKLNPTIWQRDKNHPINISQLNHV